MKHSDTDCSVAAACSEWHAHAIGHRNRRTVAKMMAMLTDSSILRYYFIFIASIVYCCAQQWLANVCTNDVRSSFPDRWKILSSWEARL